MKRDKLPVLFFVFLAAGAILVGAGGPIVLAILIMGLPFIVFFVMWGTMAHSHVDNGHFRAPDKAH